MDRARNATTTTIRETFAAHARSRPCAVLRRSVRVRIRYARRDHGAHGMEDTAESDPSRPRAHANYRAVLKLRAIALLNGISAWSTPSAPSIARFPCSRSAKRKRRRSPSRLRRTTYLPICPLSSMTLQRCILKHFDADELRVPDSPRIINHSNPDRRGVAREREGFRSIRSI